MKTGSMGGTWVDLDSPKPAPVADHYAYWNDPPPEMSERCAYWLRQIDRGWLPNRFWRREGYDASAGDLYGVYIWEWLNILSPEIERRLSRKRP